MRAVSACLILLLFLVSRPVAAQPNAPATKKATTGFPDQIDDDTLQHAEEAGPNEVCTDEIEGQFWYKVCLPHTTLEDCMENKWVPCWVYDPEKCCNVLKRKLVQVPSKRPKPGYLEKLYCAKIKVPRSALKNAPPCDCPDVPTPYHPPMVDSAKALRDNAPKVASAQSVDQKPDSRPAERNRDGKQGYFTASRTPANTSPPPKTAPPMARQQAAPSAAAIVSPATGVWQAVSYPVYYTTADGTVYQNGSQVTYYRLPQTQQVYTTYPTVVAPAPVYYYGY